VLSRLFCLGPALEQVQSVQRLVTLFEQTEPPHIQRAQSKGIVPIADPLHAKFVGIGTNGISLLAEFCKFMAGLFYSIIEPEKQLKLAFVDASG
jgi:hypothetical protein